MAGKIFKYDCYDLRKFKTTDIDTVLDIGAGIGTVSLMSRVLFPFAKIIAIEPFKETFDVLEQHVKMWGIEHHNIALGPGSDMCSVRGRFKGLHRFVSEDEKKWWKKNSYIVLSKTLPQMFDMFNIDTSKNYIIKMDCEGGERFWLKCNDTLNIVRSSIMTVIELHIGFGGTKKDWVEFFNSMLDTHDFMIGQWEEDNIGKRTRYYYKLSNPEDVPDNKKSQIELMRR